MNTQEELPNNSGRRRSWVIAIAGLMGAGKTTLAQQLERALGWRHVRERRAKDYIRDLFASPNRWAFEAQVAMFCSKALEAIESLTNGNSVVIDRSLEEDADIFAVHFKNEGHIDERAFKTYSSIARDFLTRVGPPDVTLYCDVSPEVAMVRITARQRGEENLYPEGHVNRLASAYREWIANYRIAPVYRLDSERFDWRARDIGQRISEELVDILGTLGNRLEQMDLFNNRQGAVETEARQSILEPFLNQDNTFQTQYPAPPSRNSIKPLRLSAYIAAPFTSAETVRPVDLPEAQIQLYTQSMHGRIAPGLYRNSLLAIARSLREIGFDVILPHRDVNKWGDLILHPEEVMRACTEHVSKCDLFIGVLGQSCGAHYEFGLALAAQKPCIIIIPADVSHSFVGEGVKALERVELLPKSRVLVLRTERLADAGNLVSEPAVVKFLRASIANNFLLS